MNQPTIQWKELSEQLVHLPKDISVDVPVTRSIKIDSRQCSGRDWFVAVQGEKFNGHRFILDLVKNSKVAGFFYESKDVDAKKFSSLGGIEIKDSIDFLTLLAKIWRNKVSTKVIGITGSSGKTTVKNLCHSLLSERFNCLAPKGSMNNELGVPLTLLQLSNDYPWAVVEMGARQAGDIKHLVEVANPDVVAVLNATKTHVEIFGSPLKLAQAKSEIYVHSSETAKAVAPAFDPRLLSVARQKTDGVITFGKTKEADIYFQNQRWENFQQCFDLCFKNKTIPIRSHYLHRSFALNLCSALALCSEAKLDDRQIQNAALHFSPAPGRFEKIDWRPNQIVIHDAYNSSPSSIQEGLATLHEAFAKSTKTLILGDMLELGASSQEEHQNIALLLGAVEMVEEILLVGPEMQALYDVLVTKRPNTQHFKSSDKIPAQVLRNLKSEVIYLKASNSLRFDKLIDVFKN